MFGEDNAYNYQIQAHMLEAMNDYGREGIPTGDFLRALFANDLMEAVGRADHLNQPVLAEFCMYVYNELPSTCHGSYELVDAWIALHEEKRKKEKEMEKGRPE